MKKLIKTRKERNIASPFFQELEHVIFHSGPKEKRTYYIKDSIK